MALGPLLWQLDPAHLEESTACTAGSDGDAVQSPGVSSWLSPWQPAARPSGESTVATIHKPLRRAIESALTRKKASFSEGCLGQRNPGNDLGDRLALAPAPETGAPASFVSPK